MAAQYIFTDAAELILLLKGRAGRESHIVQSADIQRISFSKCSKKLFGLISLTDRRITIICKGLGTIEFDESRHRQFFSEYLEILRQFCKANRVTFYDFPSE